MKFKSRKNKNPIKILVAILILSAGAFLLSKQFLSSRSGDIIVGQIAGENVYKSEVEAKFRQILAETNRVANFNFDKLPDQVIELFVREVYLDRKIIAEAKKLGLENTIEIKQQIENYKNTLLRQNYIDNNLKDKLTEEKIAEKHAQINAELDNKSEYSYMQIVLKEESVAQNVYNDLKVKKTLKFGDAVRKFSTDSYSMQNGGQVEHKPENTIDPEMLSVLKSLKKDEISKPVKSADNWYIIRFLASEKIKPLEYETSKEYVRHLIKMEEIEKINGKFLKDHKVKLLTKKEESSIKDSSDLNSNNSSTQTSDGDTQKLPSPENK